MSLPKISTKTLKLQLNAQGINLDPQFKSRWFAIKQYLTKPVNRLGQSYGLLQIDNCYISSNSKMRLISHIDWCYYDAKDLAVAIENNTVDSYYEQQLKHINSDPNVWARTDQEHELKSYYAARRGRASLI
jgi:hypothetical protein